MLTRVGVLMSRAGENLISLPALKKTHQIQRKMCVKNPCGGSNYSAALLDATPACNFPKIKENIVVYSCTIGN